MKMFMENFDLIDRGFLQMNSLAYYEIAVQVAKEMGYSAWIGPANEQFKSDTARSFNIARHDNEDMTPFWRAFEQRVAEYLEEV